MRERPKESVWDYPRPPRVEPVGRRVRVVHAGHIAFYAGRVDAVYLDHERVRPQGGTFYGGWITDEIEGPFTGEPGVRGVAEPRRC